MKVLVIGGRGQIGAALCALLDERGIDYQAPGRDELELTDSQQLESVLREIAPDFIINAASYSSPERAETEPSRCFAVNRDAVAQLADICAKQQRVLIHLSNWQVFDGSKNEPYTEKDPASPKGVLGNSCWQGEEQIRQRLPHHIILRLSWLISTDPRGYAWQFVEELKAGKSRTVARDYVGCPTLADDIARVVVAMIMQISCAAEVWGTYHYAAVDAVSEKEFNEALLEEASRYLELDNNLLEEACCEAVHGALISPNATLDGRKIRNTFGIHPRPWRTGVAKIMEQLWA